MGIVDAVVSLFTNDAPVEDEVITFFEEEEPENYVMPDHDDNNVEDYRDAETT